MSESEQAERSVRSGDLPPGKLDVIYIGGIPPLRQVWQDMKAILKERRELQRAVTPDLDPDKAKHSARSGELPPGKLDVIYIGGIPPLRQVWQDMKAILKERRELRNGAVDGIEWGCERRETETMARPDQPEQSHGRSGKLPPGKLDVIYTSGFPPVWQIWRRKGMVTIQPSESRRGAADGIEWDRERREAETMAELANRAEQSVESGQSERGKQSDDPPSKDFDVIYIGGIPPLRQIWADIKTVIRQRRELRQRR